MKPFCSPPDPRGPRSLATSHGSCWPACWSANAARRIDFDVFFAQSADRSGACRRRHAPMHTVCGWLAEAVRLDQLRRCPRRSILYIECALAISVAACQTWVVLLASKKTKKKKAALKARLRQYLDRAEALLPVTKHTEMHPTSSLATLSLPKDDSMVCWIATLPSTQNFGSKSRRGINVQATPVLADALDTVATAEMYVAEGYYVAAYGKLEFALNVLIDALMKEPPGPRRQHLHVQVLEWLNQATRVRALIDASENEFLSEVELLQNRDDSKVCSLQ
ncbi:hypothetical protein LSTR_LSTR008226 [Laodelphax striatellus]|uniref:MIT domain-containing protein n=1 Tax=Laodelphax striatellus TaxID=195883 RepID=A0A482WUS1_LAOST|nr:hypothetical protein LSTR_LSTR008226 [Laodelphax striatellus]